MAVVPSNASLASWIGSGAGITASTTSAGQGYWIPKALVQAYVGNDAAVTDDIRDFLFSVLSAIAATNSQEIATTDSRPTTVSVTKVVSSLNNRVSFSVVLNNTTVTQPQSYVNSLPTYA